MMPLAVSRSKRTKIRAKRGRAAAIARSPYEVLFEQLWLEIAPDIDLYSEYSGAIPGRRFRIDFCHLPSKTAIEINGSGRHQTFTGYARDMEKMRLLAYHGYTVIPFTCQQVTVESIQELAAHIRKTSPP